MNSEIVTEWLRRMVEAMPRGGKSEAAEMLGLSPSGLSKILTKPERAFDEKTIRLLAWIETSKSERFSTDDYPIIKEEASGPMIIETRKGPMGKNFLTWRAAQ